VVDWIAKKDPGKRRGPVARNAEVDQFDVPFRLTPE
jgi:hypothetical protein